MKNIFLNAPACLLVFFLCENVLAKPSECLPVSSGTSAEEIISEATKSFSEIKLLVKKSLSGKTQKESFELLNTAKDLLEKSAIKTSELYEEYSAKRKKLTASSPYYQKYMNIESDLYAVKRDFSEMSRDIERALHAESAQDMEHHLKKTEKSFLEIEKLLEETAAQLKNFKQN